MHIKEIVFSVELNGKKFQTRTFVDEKAWAKPAYQVASLEQAKADLSRRILEHLDIQMSIVETEIPDIRVPVKPKDKT